MAKRKAKKTKTAAKKVVKQKISKPKAKKALKKTAKKSVKKTPSKKAVAPKKAPVANKAVPSANQAHWETYKNLRKSVDEAWEKLQASVKKKAKPEVLLQEKNHLLLLLAECNYMARQCMRLAASQEKKKKK